MYHGWFRLCLSADGSTATAGEWGAPAPGHLPFWFKPVSAFGLLEITAFISSSPGLAMPPTLAPDRLGASSRRVLSRETRPPGSGEVSLSQELRTVGLLRPHVLVEYQWSHTGLCPGCRPVITATSAASCRTPSFSGHGYPTQRAAKVGRSHPRFLGARKWAPPSAPIRWSVSSSTQRGKVCTRRKLVRPGSPAPPEPAQQFSR